jgi:hypothetical protein
MIKSKLHHLGERKENINDIEKTRFLIHNLNRDHKDHRDLKHHKDYREFKVLRDLMDHNK